MHKFSMLPQTSAPASIEYLVCHLQYMLCICGDMYCFLLSLQCIHFTFISMDAEVQDGSTPSQGETEVGMTKASPENLVVKFKVGKKLKIS